MSFTITACTKTPGIRDDLINAGGLYENSPVVVDNNLVTSRRPEDLPCFMRELVKMVKSR
jgi:protease I